MERKQLSPEQIAEITYRAGEMLEAMDTASAEMVKAMHTMRLAYINFRAAAREIKTRPEREAELSRLTADDVAELFVASGDCAGCWCDSCANIEKCINAPLPNAIQADRPFPCWGCAPGMQYMPILEGEENCTCAGYAEAAPDTE